MIVPEAWWTAINVLGVVLLHFLWQGALLGLLYVVLRPWCKVAASRYRLGMFFILALLSCPVLTAFRLWPVAGMGDSTSAVAGAVVFASAGQSLPHWSLQATLPWLVGSWLLGVVALASRALWQWHKLQSLLRSAHAPEARWQECLIRLSERFGVRRSVRLLYSARAVTPMLIGWIKPAILLPASLLSGFPPQQIELIIAHELAHVRRWDYLANLFQIIVETVLFYHPVVHWIGRDVRDAREECCDDLVLRTSSGGSALPYARALAGLEELRLDLRAVSPALGADGGVLIARIRRIVGVTEMAQPAPRNYAVPLLLVAAVLIGMAWRAQQHAADFAAAIARLSTQALALVSGNPHLTVPADFSVSFAAPDVVAPTPALAIPTDVDVAPPSMPSFRIERPAIAASALGALARVADVVALNRIATPELDLAAPAAEAVAPREWIAPTYPAYAMQSGIEGEVTLGYRIDGSGRVVGIHVISARPSGVFEQSAKVALSAWRFPPGVAGGERSQNFQFTLNRGASTDKCQSPTGTMICRHPGD